MDRIEFVGVRGGHGATTVSLVAAAALAARCPSTIAATDPVALAAVAGASSGDLPMRLAAGVLLVADRSSATVVDAGTLRPCPDGDGPVETGEPDVADETGLLRVAVLRGPDYLGVRTLAGEGRRSVDAVVVVAEPGRALDSRDVEHVCGLPVVAVVDHTPNVARAVDAGLLVQRCHRLREFDSLRSWLAERGAAEPR